MKNFYTLYAYTDRTREILSDTITPDYLREDQIVAAREIAVQVARERRRIGAALYLVAPDGACVGCLTPEGGEWIHADLPPDAAREPEHRRCLLATEQMCRSARDLEREWWALVDERIDGWNPTREQQQAISVANTATECRMMVFQICRSPRDGRAARWEQSADWFDRQAATQDSYDFSEIAPRRAKIYRTYAELARRALEIGA